MHIIVRSFWKIWKLFFVNSMVIISIIAEKVTNIWYSRSIVRAEKSA